MTGEGVPSYTSLSQMCLGQFHNPILVMMKPIALRGTHRNEIYVEAG